MVFAYLLYSSFCSTADCVAVAMYEDYTLSADVHSFAILLWEICALEKPYKQYNSLDQLNANTVKSQRRPQLRKIRSKIVRELTQACWDPDPDARPSMALVSNQLEKAVTLPQHHP